MSLWKKNIRVKDVGELTVLGVCRGRGDEKPFAPLLCISNLLNG